MLTNPKVWLYGAVALIILGLVAGIYHEGSANAKATIELAQLQADKKALEADLVQARLNQQVLNTLDTKIIGLNDYAQKSPTGGSQCLDGADTDQLRNLWK